MTVIRSILWCPARLLAMRDCGASNCQRTPQTRARARKVRVNLAFTPVQPKGLIAAPPSPHRLWQNLDIAQGSNGAL